MSAQPAAEAVPPRLLIIDELGFVPLSRTGAELPELGTLGRKQIAALVEWHRSGGPVDPTEESVACGEAGLESVPRCT